jgi:hypothetical protein
MPKGMAYKKTIIIIKTHVHQRSSFAAQITFTALSLSNAQAAGSSSMYSQVRATLSSSCKKASHHCCWFPSPLS